jgi:hypothetical protein
MARISGAIFMKLGRAAATRIHFIIGIGIIGGEVLLIQLRSVGYKGPIRRTIMTKKSCIYLLYESPPAILRRAMPTNRVNHETVTGKERKTDLRI